MSHAYGNTLKLYIDGGSRDKLISARLSGFPAGISIDFDKLNAFTSRRKPGNQPWSTTRCEEDLSIFTSGIKSGVTTGEPIELSIHNNDAEKTYDIDYSRFPRPSHADYPAAVKYGPAVDLRGGGHFSGRLTAPLCSAGGLCLQYLEGKNVEIYAHIYSIGDIKDIPVDMLNPDIAALEKVKERAFPTVSEKNGQRMQTIIEAKRLDSNSLGGIIECFVTGLDVGLGEHMFRSAESAICNAVFAIPGVKGIEFGSGFDAAKLSGVENNDPYRIVNNKVELTKNSSGGVLGGMTTGAPLVFRVAFKPTASIPRTQSTVDLEKMVNTEIKIEGRNDPCYVPRAVPAVEAAAALAITDLYLSWHDNPDLLSEYRGIIDDCDSDIAAAIHERNSAILKVAEYKKLSNVSIYQPTREKSVIERVKTYLDGYEKDSISEIYTTLFSCSREMQITKYTTPITGYENRKFLLIGNPLVHSLSPELHSLIADYSYELCRLNEDELKDFIERNDYNGFNVTIPYKKKIIPFLKDISAEAKACGAVNTVVRDRNGGLKGYNTDIQGFIDTLKKLNLKEIPMKAVILGNGGAAAAVRYALNYIGVPEILTVSRGELNSLHYRDITENTFNSAIVINCTPCGMFPEEVSLPFSTKIIRSCAAVIDLVYNPERTELIQAAEFYNIPCISGLYMLVSQAVATAKLFTGIALPENSVESIYRQLQKTNRNIILIGMPGCGKTAVGRYISAKTGKRFFDTDADIEERTGYTPAEYINKFGVNAFRDEETVSIKTASHLRGTVIATGGGSVLNPQNRTVLKSCGRVFWIDRPLDDLDIKDRPLSEGRNANELFAERKDIYLSASDLMIEAGSIEKQADAIIGYCNGNS